MRWEASPDEPAYPTLQLFEQAPGKNISIGQQVEQYKQDGGDELAGKCSELTPASRAWQVRRLAALPDRGFMALRVSNAGGRLTCGLQKRHNESAARK